MTTLDGFEDAAKEALLNEAEDQLPELTDRLVTIAESNWRRYASRKGYDIDLIWQDVETTTARRSGNTVSQRITWPFSGLFEFGVSPHVIEGNPYLSFTWPAPPEGTRPAGAPKHVKTQSVNWGSVTGGIGESRAIRDALLQFRGELRK